ncbi:hypothetical protein BH10PLA2_BH10PLA2_22720 [soil metagenome]
MSDIRSPRLLYAKGALLLGAGILASALLLAENPSLKSAALLALAIWAFCRSYYFAFYVIEHYIDPGFRYAGLSSFLRYLVRGRREQRQETPGQSAAGPEVD